VTGFLTLFGHVGEKPKFIQRVLLGGGGVRVWVDPCLNRIKSDAVVKRKKLIIIN